MSSIEEKLLTVIKEVKQTVDLIDGVDDAQDFTDAINEVKAQITALEEKVNGITDGSGSDGGSSGGVSNEEFGALKTDVETLKTNFNEMVEELPERLNDIENKIKNNNKTGVRNMFTSDSEKVALAVMSTVAEGSPTLPVQQMYFNGEIKVKPNSGASSSNEIRIHLEVCPDRVCHFCVVSDPENRIADKKLKQCKVEVSSGNSYQLAYIEIAAPTGVMWYVEPTGIGYVIGDLSESFGFECLEGLNMTEVTDYVF